MGHTTQPISFFTDTIILTPHTCTHAEHLNRPITLGQFARGRPMRLERVQETGEYIATVGDYPDIEFIHGPETVE